MLSGLGELLLRHGDLDGAVAAFEEANGLSVALVEPYAGLGRLALQRGETGAALAWAAKALARDMEEVCPDALFLNYVNPMAMITGAF